MPSLNNNLILRTVSLLIQYAKDVSSCIANIYAPGSIQCAQCTKTSNMDCYVKAVLPSFSNHGMLSGCVFAQWDKWMNVLVVRGI